MRWYKMKNREIVGDAKGQMVMLNNGAIQLELDLYGDDGDLVLSGTLTNRLADVESAK